MLNWIKAGLTTTVTFLGYFLGGFDTMMITLLLFMVVDYLTGVAVAIKQKKVNSKIGFIGIVKKIVILLLIGSVNLLSIAINIDGLRYIAIAFYLANEGISIIENSSKLKVPIPQKIKDVLEQLKKEGE